MKKRISILLALILALSLFVTACGEKANSDDKKDDNKVENNDAQDDADDADDVADDDATEDDATDEEDDVAISYAKLEEVKGRIVREGDSNLIIRMDKADNLEYNAGWTLRYYPLEGGVYVDGDLMTHIPFVKVNTDQYLFYWPEFGVTATAGMEVTLDGVIGTADYAVKIGPTTLTYDGTTWTGEGLELRNIKEELN